MREVTLIVIDDQIEELNKFGFVFFEQRLYNDGSQLSISEKLALKAGVKRREEIKEYLPDVQFKIIPILQAEIASVETLLTVIHEHALNKQHVVFVVDRNLAHGVVGEKLMQSYFKLYSDSKRFMVLVYSTDDNLSEHIKRWKEVPNVVGFLPKPLASRVPHGNQSDWLLALQIACYSGLYRSPILERARLISHGIHPGTQPGNRVRRENVDVVHSLSLFGKNHSFSAHDLTEYLPEEEEDYSVEGQKTTSEFKN